MILGTDFFTNFYVKSFPQQELIRWYGSDSIAYGIRKLIGKEGGVHYQEIVRDVVNLLNRRLSKKEKIKIPKAITTYQLEKKLYTPSLRSPSKTRPLKKSPTC